MRILQPLVAVSAAALLAFLLTGSPPAVDAQGVPGVDPNKCLR